MAKKNMLIDYSDVPQTLNEHPFFGLTLDSEQKAFRDCIWDTEKLIVFCNAKAGTGKTTIATATSDLLVKYGRYKGVVYIAAPTQEQKQGYLAGSLEQKSEPYFEPFYQALNKLGINLMTSLCGDIINQKNGTGYIECMTHTFLRG
jgi:phosphate starvation-inducible protein PhoH and related proteins